MKRVAFWYWMLPVAGKPGKVKRSNFRMDEETAQQRYPGCQKADWAPEWRKVYEPTDDVPLNTKPVDPEKSC
jgi:hypothetical protein